MKRSWMPVRIAGFGPISDRRSIISKRKLYKVLVVRATLVDKTRLVTGTHTAFDYNSYLPKRVKGKWVPGKWLPAKKGGLVMCSMGWHVTSAPRAWMSYPLLTYEVYEVEVKGLPLWSGGNKFCCRSIRLLRKVKA